MKPRRISKHQAAPPSDGRTIRSLLIQFFEERGGSQQSIDKTILEMALLHPGELDEIVPPDHVEDFAKCLWSAYGEIMSMTQQEINHAVAEKLKSKPQCN